MQPGEGGGHSREVGAGRSGREQNGQHRASVIEPGRLHGIRSEQLQRDAVGGRTDPR